MSHYLVTGGAGFIGSHLVDQLITRGHTVRVADDFSTGRHANLAQQPGVEIVEGDLAVPGVAAQAVTGVEFVLHQAAIPSVPRSVKDPVASHRANLDATLAVLVAARDAGVKRVVFAGSSSVFGDTETLPKREDMATRPKSPYALQKLVGEQYHRMFTDLYGLETVTVRYFNVFGPRQDPSSPYSGVISLFITSLLASRRPMIHGDGEQTRDFTFVANVVDGVLRAATTPAANGGVVNVATGRRVSINRLFYTLRDLIGVSVEPQYGPDREGDVRDSQADITLAKAMLGYTPIVEFEEGLRRTVDWYKEHR